jgi:hypothetical protein
VSASHFQSDEVQDKNKVRGCTSFMLNGWGKKTAAVAELIELSLSLKGSFGLAVCPAAQS